MLKTLDDVERIADWIAAALDSVDVDPPSKSLICCEVFDAVWSGESPIESYFSRMYNKRGKADVEAALDVEEVVVEEVVVEEVLELEGLGPIGASLAGEDDSQERTKAMKKFHASIRDYAFKKEDIKRWLGKKSLVDVLTPDLVAIADRLWLLNDFWIHLQRRNWSYQNLKELRSHEEYNHDLHYCERKVRVGMLDEMMDRKTSRYRPSNSTDGAMFEARHCDQCKAGVECPIWSAAMSYNVSDSRYPSEWTYKNGQPICTAFEKNG